MELKKNEKRMLIFLGVVLLYFAYDIITDWDTYAAFFGKSKQTVQVKQESKAAADSPTTPVKQDRSYLERWGRNPFYQKVERKRLKNKVTKRKRPKLFLYAISIKDNNSVALINDRIVKIGDMIGGYTLKKINKKSVLLSEGSKSITLKLATY